MPTTISFVGQFIDSYAPLISDLRRTGADIALHDIAHTNDIAFMDRSTIVERLKRAAEWRSAYGITGFRSPSWYVSAALWNALDVCGFSYDMSALDTWPFFSKESNHGVRTFLPFGVGNLVVLPNTIPFDDMPGIVGYKPEELFAFWKPKIDAIAASGGLIMLNAHPDKWLSGNPRMLDSLGVVLRYILDTHDPARMTAREVAEHFRSQRFRGAVIDIPGEPLLAVPVATAPGSSWSIADSDNPCIQTRGAFLRKRHH
ncbi:MAG TPA: hypothetical protein VD994_13885 [Prosthecobacter sp.]|nr:hypothetical protein [Prosthecobacter sp.]